MKTVNKWVFVTGAPRSGTTFVGKILAHSARTDYIHEPFNPDCGLPCVSQRCQYLRPNESPSDHLEIESLFQYSAQLKTGYFPNDSSLRKAIKTITGSRGPFYYRIAKLNPFSNTAIIKDPIGAPMAAYLHRHYQVTPVIILRHPVAFVASVTRLGWRLDVSDFTNQPKLMADYLSDETLLPPNGNADPIVSNAIYWRLLYKVLLRQAQKHSDWVIVRHEDISSDPQTSFATLFRTLGLKWTPAVQAKITSQTSTRNSTEPKFGRVQDFNRNSAEISLSRHRMINPADRKRILEITESGLSQYDPESFQLPPRNAWHLRK